MVIFRKETNKQKKSKQEHILHFGTKSESQGKGPTVLAASCPLTPQGGVPWLVGSWLLFLSEEGM